MTGIELWSTTAANNNSAAPNGFPEGMAPSGVNDAARQVMAAIREWYEAAEWINLGDTPTYIGATSFSLVGDKTATYQVGRRIKAYGTTPFTIYGTISVSAYSSVTTVTVVWDSGSLNGTLSTIWLSINSVTNKSISSSMISGATFLTDGDKGDITVSSSGAAWAIDNDAVTYAKMQNISATSKILGRKTASAGDTEECSLSEILDFIGSAAQGDILYRGASAWARLGAGTSGQFLKTQGAGANPTWANVTAGTPNGTQTNVSAPTGTTATTAVMMGLAATITPNSSGVALVVVSGTVSNTVSGSGAKYQIRYGTGSAPANGDALTGTAVGSQPAPILFPTPNYQTPFAVNAVITGLTPSTAYWIDISLAAVTSGTAAVANVGVSAAEIH